MSRKTKLSFAYGFLVFALLVCIASFLTILTSRGDTAPPKRVALPTSGMASWYGENLRGRPMANGKPFVPEAMTCATLKYPFGTRLRVTNVKTGASVVVTCTDRGPAGWLKPYRCVDLSSGAFSRIADLTSGLASVTMRVEN